MKTYYLNFNGFWLQSNLNTLPNQSGIYAIYRCVYNVRTNRVDIKALLYIGQAQDVNDRISKHEKTPEFQKELQYGEQICLAFAPLSLSDLDRVENALICTQKPPLNKVLTDSFNHPSTTVEVSGHYDLFTPGTWKTNDGREIIIITR